MALKLTCPNCGARPHTEFWYGGEVESPEEARASAAAPAPAAAASSATPAENALEADFARVWLRRNRYGLQHERWFHHAGCRRWHTAVRDTVANQVHASA